MYHHRRRRLVSEALSPLVFQACFNLPYCDLLVRIKGAARALYPVNVERAQIWPVFHGHL